MKTWCRKFITARSVFVAFGSILFSDPVNAREFKVANIRDAILFAYPLYEMQRTRVDTISQMRASGRAVANRLVHRQRLATSLDRAVTTPNNDTLTSSAWLDLTAGPVILNVPELRDRYHSVALMDAFTDHFAVIGTRMNGGRGGRFMITGPAWKGRAPKGTIIIRSPTNIAWLLIRVLVAGEKDIAAAQNAQSQFTLLSPSPEPIYDYARLPSLPTPQLLFDGASEMLQKAGVPVSKRRELRSLAPFGLASGASFQNLPRPLQDQWGEALTSVLKELEAGLAASAKNRRGWSYQSAKIGTARATSFERAAIARGGLAALPAKEALYLSHLGDGIGCYKLTLPAKIPLRSHGFWSLTIYEVESDGRRFLARNEKDRYSIGDRTEGLIKTNDGNIEILIAENPPDKSQNNWIPIPSRKWELVIRIYLPSFTSTAHLIESINFNVC